MKNTNKTLARQETNQQKAYISGLSHNLLVEYILKSSKESKRIFNVAIKCINDGYPNPSQQLIADRSFTKRETVNRVCKRAQKKIGLLLMDSGKYTYNTNHYMFIDELYHPVVKEQLQEALPQLMLSINIRSCQSIKSSKVTPIYYIRYTESDWVNDWINSNTRTSIFNKNNQLIAGIDPGGDLDPTKTSISAYQQQDADYTASLFAVDLIKPAGQSGNYLDSRDHMITEQIRSIGAEFGFTEYAMLQLLGYDPDTITIAYDYTKKHLKEIDHAFKFFVTICRKTCQIRGIKPDYTHSLLLISTLGYKMGDKLLLSDKESQPRFDNPPVQDPINGNGTAVEQSVDTTKLVRQNKFALDLQKMLGIIN